MKRRSVYTMIVTIFVMVMLAGCGKSDEQKARDEIMSHMSDSEKAAIADDQKAIADYEAEKQAQADAIANEKPINYSEVLAERELGNIVFDNCSLVNIPISVLLPGDEYLYGGKGYDIERDVARGMYNYGQNQLAVSENFAVVPINSVSGNAEDCGNYTIYVQTANSSIGAYYLFVIENNSDYALQIVVTAAIKDYYDCAEAMFNKSYEHIREQLTTAGPYDISEEALGDAEPEIFGTYTCDNGNNLAIGYGDDGFAISITGSYEYNGTLTWLADDLYESRTDNIWVQTQLTSDGITIRSSYLPLEGSYTRN